MDELSYFAQNLKFFRERKKLTKTKMAEYLGVTLTAYSMYETGQREPKISALKLISQILSVRIDDLFRDFQETENDANTDNAWLHEIASDLEVETGMRIVESKDNDKLIVIAAEQGSFATGTNLKKEDYTWRYIDRKELRELVINSKITALHQLSLALKIHFFATEKEFYENIKKGQN